MDFSQIYISTSLNEDKVKGKRRLNLIFYNLPESTSNVNETGKSDDIKAVYGIVKIIWVQKPSFQML